MDLLALLNAELEKLNITSDKEIMDHFYKRTGEIFEFDPKIVFGTEEERHILNEIRVDIRNVTDFQINCFSWSYLFCDLLHAKNIKAEVKFIKNHAYVEVTLNDSVYVCDLMARFEDLVRIKFNFEPKYKILLSTKGDNLETKKDEDLEVFLKYLEIRFANMQVDSVEKRTFIVLEFLKKYINSRCKNHNIDYISGIQFINKILMQMSYMIIKPHVTYLVNNEENFYADVYTIEINNKNIYYVFSKINNVYELHEQSFEEVNKLYEKCSFTKGYILAKKNNKR